MSRIHNEIMFAALLLAFAGARGLQAQDAMKDDKMKHDGMQMEQKDAKPAYTGTFHGKVHKTSGRATVYQQPDGSYVLRLTNFKTSNGPDVT